ncbi:MAG: hypothetical protein MHMPM18_000243 [Marteilia pararefringens]
MISSKIVVYAPIVSATGFCVSSICRCGLKEYIRRQTHNRNDLRTLMHLNHTRDNKVQPAIDNRSSTNVRNHSGSKNDQEKPESNQEKMSGVTFDLDSSAKGEEVHRSIDSHSSTDNEYSSQSEKNERKQGSDYLEKSGDTRDKISDSGSSTNEKEEQELIDNKSSTNDGNHINSKSYERKPENDQKKKKQVTFDLGSSAKGEKEQPSNNSHSSKDDTAYPGIPYIDSGVED